MLKRPGEVAVVDVPRRDRPDWVTIRVKAAGVCGSDIAAYKGQSPLVSYPRILGHELAGEVVAAPAGSGLKGGDQVVAEPYIYCGACNPCRAGRTNCCENLQVIGVHADGGMAEFFSHPAQLVHKVPGGISWEELTVVEPLTIALHGLRRAALAAGEFVVVTGAGTIGLLTAQAALAIGAKPVVVDPVPSRLKLARELGVEWTVDPAAEDAVAAIATVTGGRMAPVVVEASGAEAAVRSVLDYVANAGRVALIGYPKGDVPLPTFLFTKKELDVRGSRNSAGQFPTAIGLIAGGRVQAARIISQVAAFDDLPAYIRRLADNPGDLLKVVAKL